MEKEFSTADVENNVESVEKMSQNSRAKKIAVKHKKQAQSILHLFFV